jgi:2'-5' RNA ligase
VTARFAFAANRLLMSRLAPRVPGEPGAELNAIGRARFLTTVVRLPAEVAERLAEAASGLDRIQPGHYLYPPQSIHLTVLGLADVPDAERAVEAAVHGHRPFALEVRGLNLSRDTAFAELHPRGTELRALRKDLRAVESHEHGSVSRWIRRRLAHANVVRFRAPVERRLVAEVGRLRRVSFGEFEVAEVELVHTDKVLSDAGTRTLARYRLT